MIDCCLDVEKNLHCLEILLPEFFMNLCVISFFHRSRSFMPLESGLMHVFLDIFTKMETGIGGGGIWCDLDGFYPGILSVV